jgi:type V secretory pathway adhesin AidA
MRLLNYRDEDIRNYLAEISLKQDTQTRKYLKDTVYKSWLKKGIMSRDQFTVIMHEQGYSKQDIENMIIEVESGKNISQASIN